MEEMQLTAIDIQRGRLLLGGRGLGTEAGDEGMGADLEIEVAVTAHRLKDIGKDLDWLV